MIFSITPSLTVDRIAVHLFFLWLLPSLSLEQVEQMQFAVLGTFKRQPTKPNITNQRKNHLNHALGKALSSFWLPQQQFLPLQNTVTPFPHHRPHCSLGTRSAAHDSYVLVLTSVFYHVTLPGPCLFDVRSPERLHQGHSLSRRFVLWKDTLPRYTYILISVFINMDCKSISFSKLVFCLVLWHF